MYVCLIRSRVPFPRLAILTPAYKRYGNHQKYQSDRDTLRVEYILNIQV